MWGGGGCQNGRWKVRKVERMKGGAGRKESRAEKHERNGQDGPKWGHNLRKEGKDGRKTI
jgi:hypothetical protein